MPDEIDESPGRQYASSVSRRNNTIRLLVRVVCGPTVKGQARNSKFEILNSANYRNAISKTNSKSVNTVWDFDHLILDIVSSFEISISDFSKWFVACSAMRPAPMLTFGELLLK